MLQKGDLGRLLGYTNWANHRIIRRAATLRTGDFKRDLGASHGGVRGTLTHILAAEWIWVERFKGISPSHRIDEGEFPDIIALRDRWSAIQEYRQVWFQELKQEATSGIILYTSQDGQSHQAPLWKLVQHMVNHSTYHRGQVVLLLRLLGATPPSTDLVLWDRKRQAVRNRKQETFDPTKE